MDEKFLKDWCKIAARAAEAVINGDLEEAERLTEEGERLAKGYAERCLYGENGKPSKERIKWLKDVARNLARNTHKYERMAIYKELSIHEQTLLSQFEHKENTKLIEKMKIEFNKDRREQESFLRETEEFIRRLKRNDSSSTINYPFPLGEA